MVKMMQNDLSYMLPNSNGVRVCELAIKELSHMAVQVVDRTMKEGSNEQYVYLKKCSVNHVMLLLSECTPFAKVFLFLCKTT
jgi:hypothetical protein